MKFASDYTLGIVGYGDIGYNCAKAIKNTLGMKVIGLKRTPDKTSNEHKRYVDELVGYDKF